MIEDKEIFDLFVDESDEVLESVIDDIITFENNLEEVAVNRVFRAFHSLKGNALMLGFEQLGEFAHKAENLLSLVRSRGVDVNKATVDILLHTVDAMKLIIRDIRNGDGDGRDTVIAMKHLDDTLSLAKQTTVIAAETVQRHTQPTPTLSAVDYQQAQYAAPVHEMVKGGFVLDLSEKPAVTPEPVQVSQHVPHNTSRDNEWVPVYEKASRKQLKILIVEDDFVSRTMLDKFLSEYGYCVIAKDGMEAIYAFEESYLSVPPHPYDLICMDIMMPIIDGLHASKKIREIERSKGVEGTLNETAIMITSAVQDPATIIRACYECGANYYFLKPLDFNKMKSQMQKIRLIT